MVLTIPLFVVLFALPCLVLPYLTCLALSCLTLPYLTCLALSCFVLPRNYYPTSEQGFELAHHGAVNDAVFSPSEGRVATAGGDALIKVCACK